MGDLLDLLLRLLFAREISGHPLLLLDAVLQRVQSRTARHDDLEPGVRLHAALQDVH